MIIKEHVLRACIGTDIFSLTLKGSDSCFRYCATCIGIVLLMLIASLYVAEYLPTRVYNLPECEKGWNGWKDSTMREWAVAWRRNVLNTCQHVHCVGSVVAKYHRLVGRKKGKSRWRCVLMLSISFHL